VPQSIYNLIATSKGNLTLLYPTFLRTLVNVSPHLKSLSTTSSQKLISLFNSMASPTFLLAKESNPALLHILLETLSNIIEHQHTHNPILLYAIVRNHSKFEALGQFDLHKAQADLEDRKRAKAKEGETSPARRTSEGTPVPQTPTVRVSGDSPATPSFSVGGEDEDEPEEEEEEYQRPMSEKARGKLPEGVEIPRRESNFSMRSSPGIMSPVPDRREFHPTDSWVPPSSFFVLVWTLANMEVSTWLPYLPLMSIIQLINQLEPTIQTLLSSTTTPSTKPILEYLRTTPLTLSDPPPPEVDPFAWTAQAIVWYKSFLWGQIFATEMELGQGAVGIWKDTNVRLFRVQLDRGADEGLRGMARDMSANRVDRMARGVLQRLGSVNLGGGREGE
jgi:High-temperature-induced dauer-formation protein